MERCASPRLPAVVLLLLCALPSRVAAQQFVCWPIAAGDTASSLARRLTGNADSGVRPRLSDQGSGTADVRAEVTLSASPIGLAGLRRAGTGPENSGRVRTGGRAGRIGDGARPADRDNSTGARLSAVDSRSRRSNADRRPLRRDDRCRGPVDHVAVGGGWLTDATPHSTVGSARRRELRHRVCAAAHRRILGGSTDPDAVAVRSPQTAARDLHCARSRPSIPQPGRSQEECGIRRRSRHTCPWELCSQQTPACRRQVGRGDD